MAFESVPWKSGNTPAFYLMQTLMELGKTDLMRDNDFVDSSSAINSHFTDSGLFGMSIEGPGSHSAELLSTMLEQLNSLREPIPDGQLATAKNILKMNVMMNLENQGDRLEEIARNFMTFGDLTFAQYCDRIDAVTSAQINAAAKLALSGKPTMLVTGGAINLVPTVTEVAGQLN